MVEITCNFYFSLVGLVAMIGLFCMLPPNPIHLALGGCVVFCLGWCAL